jgi:hypothetical protein
MRNVHVAWLAAAAALSGAFQPTSVPEASRAPEVLRYAAASGPLVDRSSPAPLRTSNLAKLRDLNFFRGGSRRRHHSFTGVPCSVAQGKRNARKARNRLRHKKHWKQAVR